ncbi:hypothetical protein I4U23_022529 [Adineta vaga]|nr:hypothetical protein I4U23_022529 [Adineta vaga]
MVVSNRLYTPYMPDMPCTVTKKKVMKVVTGLLRNKCESGTRHNPKSRIEATSVYTRGILIYLQMLKMITVAYVEKRTVIAEREHHKHRNARHAPFTIKFRNSQRFEEQSLKMHDYLSQLNNTNFDEFELADDDEDNDGDSSSNDDITDEMKKMIKKIQ